MKGISILILYVLLSSTVIAQEKEPLFSLLSGVKNSSEFALKKNLLKQELEVDAMKNEPDGARQIQRLENFSANLTCITAYMELKGEIDKLITQLKADLTISNKKKLIKDLNQGTSEAGSWYKLTLDRTQSLHSSLINCTEEMHFSASVGEVTGIFTALVSVVTSGRDFRAQQIKALCEILETLRLKDFTELTAANSGREVKKDEKDQ